VKPIDFIKAAGLSIAILVVNVLISFAVVAIYSWAIAPGHDAAFYEAAAQRIAPWSSVVFGAPLFYVACAFAARRRPARSAVAFAGSCFAVYALIDLSMLLAAGAVSSMLGAVSVSLATKLIGALAGARAGLSTRPRDT
jgi:hypothetical protein